MQGIIMSFDYVIQGNMFWQSMGMTTATAMFIGAILFHESERPAFQKALMTVITYALFLMFTSFSRVSPNINEGIISMKTYASIITTLMITVAYVIGLLFGYCILKKRK